VKHDIIERHKTFKAIQNVRGIMFIYHSQKYLNM